MIGTFAGLLAAVSVLFALSPPSRRSLPSAQPPSDRFRRATVPGPAWRAGLAGVVIFLGTRSLSAAALFSIVAAVSPFLLAARSSQAERRRERTALPETLEVVAMAMSAGMTIERSVHFVVRCGPDPARSAFESVARQLAAGSSRRAALTALAERMEGLYSPLVEVLLAAERDGAPVALLLDRLANEATRAYQNAAEERARRTPVLLLAPLMICSLPAVLIGSVVPFVALTLEQSPF